MANLNFQRLKVKLVEMCKTDEILIDFQDYKSNISSMSLTNKNNSSTVIDKYIEIFGKVKYEGGEDADSILFILTLIFKNLMSTNKPIKVLEVGSRDGFISKYILEILNYFNEENELTCIDTFNEPANNYGMFNCTNSFELYRNNIGSVGTVENINTIIGHPIRVCEQLKNDCYDIIYINYKYSDSIFIEKYINKLKENGLLLIGLNNDMNKLNDYKYKYSWKDVNINQNIIVYNTITKNEKEYFEMESADYQYKAVFKNIYEAKNYLIDDIKYIVNNIDDLSIENKIDSCINLVNNMEEILIQVNEKLINIDLKYFANEVKNSLLDVKISLQDKGLVQIFEKDLIEATNELDNLIDIEFKNRF
ncbi:hypothetical protein [Paraclostridium bifermentans]|uniref:hypothetical protein n=1 Tax=Paraclostridium bifermentans TaxID=1490 RepID=UPI00359C10FC